LENESVSRLSLSLGLTRNIAGVKFLAYRQEFEACGAAQVEGKMSFCAMVNKACHSEEIKANGTNYSCMSGAQSTGVLDEPEAAKSGRWAKECGLYSSHAIARQIVDGMQHIKQKIYGVNVAPLAEMNEADVVVIIGNARQMMRIMQGYAYHYGVARHISTVGNQAICSDLVAKPFSNNDINISLMCSGARANTRCEEGEMGAGMPIQMFKRVVDGVMATMNLVEKNDMKEKILARLKTPDELGTPVILNHSYAANLAKYRQYCAEMVESEGEYTR
jgi:uncharacterized protein (DUF169 family)